MEQDYYCYGGRVGQASNRLVDQGVDDLYGYSGDNQAYSGGRQFNYGTRPRYGSPCDRSCSEDQDADQRIEQWRPDTSLSSPEAREWFKQSRESLHRPLERNCDGTYTVQHEDCLETIAQRMLQERGCHITRKRIDSQVADLIKLNVSRYPTLTHNPEFVGDGWTLRLES
jgi:hypothetical protein